MEEAINTKVLNNKKKLVFSIAGTAASLVIFFIFAYYSLENVGGSDFYGYYAQSLLLKQGQVYVAVEPWNLQRPMVKGIFRIFRVKKIMIIKGWGDFFLL